VQSEPKQNPRKQPSGTTNARPAGHCHGRAMQRHARQRLAWQQSPLANAELLSCLNFLGPGLGEIGERQLSVNADESRVVLSFGNLAKAWCGLRRSRHDSGWKAPELAVGVRFLLVSVQPVSPDQDCRARSRSVNSESSMDGVEPSSANSATAFSREIVLPASSACSAGQGRAASNSITAASHSRCTPRVTSAQTELGVPLTHAAFFQLRISAWSLVRYSSIITAGGRKAAVGLDVEDCVRGDGVTAKSVPGTGKGGAGPPRAQPNRRREKTAAPNAFVGLISWMVRRGPEHSQSPNLPEAAPGHPASSRPSLPNKRQQAYHETGRRRTVPGGLPPSHQAEPTAGSRGMMATPIVRSRAGPRYGVHRTGD
jgi:hypothetical protein